MFFFAAFGLASRFRGSSESAGPVAASNRSAAPLHDQTLVELSQRGDREAFDEIVARHSDAIYNLCYYNLRDTEEASDAAQNTFLRAWRGIHTFRGDSSLRTWLHRIAINVIADTASKRSRTPQPVSSLTVDGDDETPNLTEAVPDPSPDAFARVQSQQRRQAVQEALRALPAHHRDVLVLFDVQGHSYEDVAAILELPMGTVKSRLSRARLALKALLEECRELFED